MKKTDADNLYLIAFIDISDRADILMLEIRHLQHSIINSLHAPTLFLPLRYEEKLIYEGWENTEKRNNSAHFDAAQLTCQHIIRYPSPQKAIRLLGVEKTEKSKNSEINDVLLKRIGEIWSGDLWTRGERRHYHVLRSLQILKQQVFRNKVLFYQKAKKVGLINHVSRRKATLDKPALMILRRAILYRLNKFIRILRTHQQQFGKSLDFGLQGYPRPSIERRREIGIYNDFLSNRTVDLQQEMQFLSEKILDAKSLDADKVTPLILHGWSQSPRVSNTQLYDNVSRHLQRQGIEDNPPKIQDISFIDTSFWSPDRPDLQPLVAKEVADSVIRNRLGNLDDDYLSNNVNDFSSLMVILLQEVNSFTKDVDVLKPVREGVRSLLRELSGDFLAASIKGIPYLYALYLTLVGEGLEAQLRAFGTINLNSVYELKGGVLSYEENFSWYFRLRLVSFWLRKVAHTPESSLDKIVLTGTTQVCDEIIEFLDLNTPPTRDACGVLWHQLCVRLEQKINKSFLVTGIQRWRDERSRDTWDEELKRSGDKNYLRSTMRLHPQLQRHLFEQILYNKSCETYKPLYDDKEKDEDELFNEFESIYGLKPTKVFHTSGIKGGTDLKSPRWLFRHLHDIPFQCAIMRSIDFLGRADSSNSQNQVKPCSWKEFIKQTHHDMSMGRELFALALEFYTWVRESPKNRLVLCINLIAFILPELEKEKKDKDVSAVYKKLCYWLDAESATENDKKYIAKHYSLYSYKKMHKNFSFRSSSFQPESKNLKRLKALGARNISAAFSLAIEKNKTTQERRLEQLSGYKLKELLELYNRSVDKHIDEQKEPLSLLAGLGALLKLRNPKENEQADHFYSTLLPKFSDRKMEEKSSIYEVKKINPVMISRIAMTNYYTVADHLPCPSEEEANNNGIGTNTDQKNLNAFSLREGITRNGWSANNKSDNDAEKKPRSLINSIMMGRYDAISINATRLPCHCVLPTFDDADDTNEENERFVTHFIRREAALAVRIFRGEALPKENIETELVSIISISLQRRAMRLNILYRILKAVKEEKTSAALPNLEASLRDCIKVKEADNLKITGYLTDGWGDLLLVFETNKNNPDQAKNKVLIDQIFEIQQALYEDFMVDRTELIFTPECLDYFASNESQYGFTFALRLLEDRKLENSVQNFNKAFQYKFNHDVYGALIEKNKTSLVSAIGQIDYFVRLAIKPNQASDSVFKQSIDWFAKKYDRETNKNLIDGVSQLYPDGMAMLDRIETIIEKKIKLEKDQ